MGRMTYRPEACKDCLTDYKARQKKYKKHRTLSKKILGYCPWCERYFRYRVKTEIRNTAYCEEASNWITACKECREEDYAYYADLWEQYYGSI